MRIPHPVDAVGALAGIPVALAVTAMVKLARPAPGTVYGLAERGAMVSVDGFGVDGLRTLSGIALAHGDPLDPGAPLIVVATDLVPERHPDAGLELRRTAAKLAFRDRMFAEGRISRIDEEPEEVPGRLAWTEAAVEIVIGDAAEARSETAETRSETALVLPSGYWAVGTVVAKAHVIVSGRGPCADRVHLVALTGLGAYVTGTRSRALRLAKRTFG